MPDFNPEASNEAAPPLTVEEAIAHLHGKDLSLRYYAAWWLGKFRISDPAVVDALIEALEDEADRTELGGYPLRRNAARALGKLGDQRAVPGLIRCLDCADFYVREAAAQSLEMLGDPAAIPALRQLLASGVAAAERVPGRPHLQEPCEAVMEALGTLKATEAIPLIQPFLENPTAELTSTTGSFSTSSHFLPLPSPSKFMPFITNATSTRSLASTCKTTHLPSFPLRYW